MSMLTVFYRRRIRMVQYGAICFTVCALVFDTPTAPTAPTAPSVIALVVAAVGVLLCLVRATASSADVERAVEPPVRGRWLALNSPSTKVPSHGIRAYGQAYAIDLARWPDEGELDWGAGWARPEDVIGFGDSVHAMVDGEVVRASGWRRDHRCRTSVFALFYLFIEGSLLESNPRRRVIATLACPRTVRCWSAAEEGRAAPIRSTGLCAQTHLHRKELVVKQVLWTGLIPGLLLGIITGITLFPDSVLAGGLFGIGIGTAFAASLWRPDANDNGRT